MSKPMSRNNMVDVFPINDEHLKLLAKITAIEFEEMYNELDIVRLYAAIDNMAEELLDRLAIDFKVDWWDFSFSLEEKRKLFKNLWIVHKKLGTKTAVNSVLGGIYRDAKIDEWFSYGGSPYRFKLVIDTEDVLPSFDKLWSLLSKIDYFKNQRSYLEKIEASTTKKADLYVGFALENTGIITMNIEGVNVDDYVVFADEDGNFFTDSGSVLIE